MVSHSLPQNVRRQKRAATPEGMAYCSACDQYKATSEFSKDSRRKSGLNCQCRTCQSAYAKNYYSKLGQEQKDKLRTYTQTPRARAQQAAYRARPEIKARATAYNHSPEHKAKINKWNATPERKAKRAAYEAARRSSSERRDKHSAATRSRKYGITPQGYDTLLVSQNGVCAICKKPETVRRNGKILPLCVDHDHNTKAVRGLLCRACNSALGHFDDNIVNLSNAIDYLKKFNQK